MPVRVLLVSLLLIAVTACGHSRGRKEPVWPYPEEPQPSRPMPQPRMPTEPMPGVPSPVPQPLPQPERPIPTYPKSAEEISGAAVVSLIRQARGQLDAGQPQQAAAALERAQRIEPRNYFVWSMLAQAQLKQGNFDQAESVALKSNSLARGNLYVELENWKTIGQARELRNDAEGAAQAQMRIDEIERLLSGADPG